MPSEIAKFLTPLTGSDGSGSPLQDGSVRALHALALTNTGDQFATAVREVNWSAVRDRCEDLLGQSRHLEVAVPYAVALLKLEGLTGFVHGLEIIATWLDRFWETLHPRLDPADGNDPTERITILETLSAPVATFGDRWQVLASLRNAELVRVPASGPLAIGSVLEARRGGVGLPGVQSLDAVAVDKALRGVPGDILQQRRDELRAARRHLAAIEACFQAKAADQRSPNLGALDRDLSDLLAPLEAILAPVPPPIIPPPEVVELSKVKINPLEEGRAGEIGSSEQVLAALDQICRFYQAHQPASPLPLLLQRARRLVKADFLTIVGDLAPNALSDFKMATGFKDPAPEAAS